MAGDDRHPELRCEACGHPGADTCVRIADGPAGTPGRELYEHAACAAARGVRPMYRLTAGSLS
jgi:hypothetical protein